MSQALVSLTFFLLGLALLMLAAWQITMGVTSLTANAISRPYSPIAGFGLLASAILPALLGGWLLLLGLL